MKFLSRAVLVLSLAFFISACCQQKVCPPTQNFSEVKTGSPDVLATVKGESITDASLRQEPGVKMKLYEAELGVYQAELKAHEDLQDILRDSILQKILSQAAAAKNMSVDDYLKAEVDSKVPNPSDAEIKKFYDERKIPKPLDSIKDRIAEFLKNQKMADVRKNYMDQLLKDNQVVMNIPEFTKAKPLPPKMEIAYEPTDPMIGAKNAKVTIVEFSDYQCPYCKRADETVKAVLKKYPKDVKVVFRHYPLPMHKDAKPAAMAAACAGDQNKFWKMHDILFENQQALKEEDLKGYAKKLKLNEKQYNDCMSSKKYEAKVDKDQADGNAYGVTGTPAFFINGRFLSGARALPEFEELINLELYNAQKNG